MLCCIMCYCCAEGCPFWGAEGPAVGAAIAECAASRGHPACRSVVVAADRAGSPAAVVAESLNQAPCRDRSRACHTV
jgi:hypothetical protein